MAAQGYHFAYDTQTKKWIAATTKLGFGASVYSLTADLPAVKKAGARAREPPAHLTNTTSASHSPGREPSTAANEL